MNSSLLACFLAMAMATTFASPSLPEGQSVFQIQQGDSDHAFNNTLPPSNFARLTTKLCKADLKPNQFRQKCDGKDGYVCKNDRYGPIECGAIHKPEKKEKDYAKFDCDHIIDVHFVAGAFDSAGFCGAMTDIRGFDSTKALKSDEYYIGWIKAAMNNPDSLVYLDHEVHGIKTDIIKSHLGQKIDLDDYPGNLYTKLLKMYHDKIFVVQGVNVATALDTSAYEALKKMVDDLPEGGQKKVAEKYLDDNKWETKTTISNSREAASKTWDEVEAPWLKAAGLN